MRDMGIFTKEARPRGKQEKARDADRHETALQYLTACESKRSKKDQVRERSRCVGGAGCF